MDSFISKGVLMLMFCRQPQHQMSCLLLR